MSVDDKLITSAPVPHQTHDQRGDDQYGDDRDRDPQNNFDDRHHALSQEG